MNKPITSYIKGAPSFNGIPVKQTVKPGAGDVKSTQEGKTETKKENVDPVKTEEKKDYVGAANDACSAEYIAKNGNSACEKYEALPQEVKDKANKTVTETCPEGSTKDADGNCVKETTTTTPGSQGDIYIATEGRGLKPWQQRQINRSTKINTRETRQAKNKRDRIERRMEGLDPTSKKYKRLANKLESATSRVDAFEAGVQNNLTFRKSGRGQGENYYKGDQKMNPGQVSQNQDSFNAQATLNKEKAKYEADLAKQNKANQTVTSNSVGQAQGAVKIEPAKVNPFAEATQNLEKLKKDMAAAGTYTVPTSGLFSKRGALKKSYFKNK